MILNQIVPITTSFHYQNNHEISLMVVYLSSIFILIYPVFFIFKSDFLNIFSRKIFLLFAKLEAYGLLKSLVGAILERGLIMVLVA